jgi:excinuclease ABC subunit B
LGVYDVVVGINLLREGLDLPEVSLVAILDADKEGYLRSEEALVQTMGRAARHINAHVTMYADTVTGSMHKAIQETVRRRQVQEAYNRDHGITPQGITKAVKDITQRVQAIAETRTPYAATSISREEIFELIKQLESDMKAAARNLEFEKAAMLRDRISELRQDDGLISL